MANQDQQDRSVRPPQPEAAAQDPRNAAIQEQVRENAEASREGTAHQHTPTPNEVSEKTVAEIAEEAEARARR